MAARHRAVPAADFADQADLLLGRVGASPTGAGDDLNTLDRRGANHAACHDAEPATHSGGDLQISARCPRSHKAASGRRLPPISGAGNVAPFGTSEMVRFAPGAEVRRRLDNGRSDWRPLSDIQSRRFGPCQYKLMRCIGT